MREHRLDRHYSISEFMDLEYSESEMKYEYINGNIYAMSGGTIKHGLISANTLFALRSALANGQKPCITFGSDVKVAISEANSYVYPDVFVVCGEMEQDQEIKEAITNPILIVEVLSKSTHNYDQNKKFRLYRTLSSFKEYIIIDQDQATVDVFYRERENSWQIATYAGLDRIIPLTSLGIEIAMASLYENITFD